MSPLRGPPTATLFVQLLGLVVLTLAGSIAVNLLVILNLPAPAPDFYRVTEVAHVLKQGPGARTHDRRPLRVRLSNYPPPGSLSDLPEGPGPLKVELAQLVGTTPDNIEISAEYGRFPDRRILHLVRQELARAGEPKEEHFLIAPFEVALHEPDGRWVIAEPAPSYMPTPWQERIILGFVFTTLALTPIAYLLARRLAAPIAQFARAAERLGRDPGSPPLVLRGPTEVGIAVRAFNDMQQRLARYVDDRTAMVAAIAHDLRTPLTRLRFRVEQAPDELSGKMTADIAEMEAMVTGVLAFVRDATRSAERTPLELSSLLESLADDMSETGLDVAVEHADRVVVEGDPLALRRLFNNLLDNALKFGRRARIRVYREIELAVVEIQDDGPGVPEAERERVFEPFYRREASRSRETGGIGLGLAVVRSIARAHGGDANLDGAPGGGLVVRVTLPI